MQSQSDVSKNIYLLCPSLSFYGPEKAVPNHKHQLRKNISFPWDGNTRVKKLHCL